ncbi:MAG: nucleoside kinase [Spirochaetes bacterium]|nr:nucleoside kinase [Spirochaetota bacterium]
MKNKLKVTLNNGAFKSLYLAAGTTVSELLKEIDGSEEEFIAAKVNNEVTSLSYKIHVNSDVEFLTKTNYLGMEVYRRSLSFLLEKVVKRIFPERRLLIGHSLGPGYYFDLEGEKLTENDVNKIEKEMMREVKEDIDITREKISYEDALEYFKKTNRMDKYTLISSLNMPKFAIYRCDDFFQVVDLPLVNRTGVLAVFKLIYYPPGFILQFPKKSSPNIPAELNEQKRIFEVYQEYKKWGKILKVDNVGGLNKIITDSGIKNFIQISEALHASKITSLANEIYAKKDEVKLICIAGPSSSGKTTFSKRLSIQLQVLGFKPVTISVDNYFIERDKTPLGEDGKPDYETIDAINIDQFNHDLDKLINGKKIKLPTYNFLTGKSLLSKNFFSINKDDIIIIEGIHCLNERLTHVIPKSKKYKIYISVLTQMNIDDNNRIPTTDNRIIRRMVRDFKYRGHSALKTLQMWPAVRKGEEKYIFPFQNDADGYFNSALDYELALLRPFAEPLLMQIKPFNVEYAEAARLLRFLSYFLTIQSRDVPPTSLLREFIGGSFFNY